MADKKKRLEGLGIDAGGLMAHAFGGVAAGIGAGLAGKTDARLLLTAAALNGMLAGLASEDPRTAAEEAVRYADACLEALRSIPDPRAQQEEQVEE